MNIFLILLAFYSITPVRAATTYPDCAGAQINSLVVSGFEQLPEMLDYCQTPAAKVPATILAIIPWAKQMNEKLEIFFGVPMARLLPSGLNILLKGNNYPGNSTFKKSIIILNYFPDWDLTREGIPWDDFTYLHEASHLVQLDLLSDTPRAIRAIARRGNFFESFPDFVPFYITGQREFTYSPPEFQGCFNSGRRSAYDFTFYRPYRRFTYYGNKTRIECCDRAEQAGPISSRMKRACDGVRVIWNDYFKDTYPSPTELQETFDPARHCLDSKGVYSYFRCNEHATGVAINSFLFHLADEIGLDARDLYLNALTTISEPSTVATYPNLIKALRDQMLTPREQETFDLFWILHTMDVTLVLDRMQP